MLTVSPCSRYAYDEGTEHLLRALLYVEAARALAQGHTLNLASCPLLDSETVTADGPTLLRHSCSEFQTAIACLEAALLKCPNHPSVLNRLAVTIRNYCVVQSELGAGDAALAHRRRARMLRQALQANTAKSADVAKVSYDVLCGENENSCASAVSLCHFVCVCQLMLAAFHEDMDFQAKQALAHPPSDRKAGAASRPHTHKRRREHTGTVTLTASCFVRGPVGAVPVRAASAAMPPRK